MNRNSGTQKIEPDPDGVGLGSTARRVSGWTSNFIVSGIVILLTIVGGRELVSLWRSPSSEAQFSLSAVSSLPIADEMQNGSVQLEFGDMPFAIRRANMRGSIDDALYQMRAECRQILSDQSRASTGEAVDDLVDTSLVDASSVDASVVEQNLFESLDQQTPVEREIGKWRMYQTGAALPLVIGIREFRSGAIASGSQQMAVWAMVSPDGPEAWKTFVCIPHSEQHSEFAGHNVFIPIPLECNRTMSIKSLSGLQLIGFRGGEADRIIQFYESWAVETGHIRVGEWEINERLWIAKFERENASPTKMETTIDIRLASDGSDKLHGLLTINTSQSESTQ